jgi:hypothetical protein
MASDMIAEPIHGRRKHSAAMIAAGALVLASCVADAATASIYKCLGANLALIYTDQPCKGGEQLDIHAGDADPAAVAQLQRARDQLDRSAAARIVDERRTAAQRDLAALARREEDEDRSAAMTPITAPRHTTTLYCGIRRLSRFVQGTRRARIHPAPRRGEVSRPIRRMSCPGRRCIAGIMCESENTLLRRRRLPCKCPTR